MSQNSDGIEVVVKKRKKKAKSPARSGELNANAKYSNADIEMMRRYRRGGWSHKDLGLLFGCTQGTSSLIVRGLAYRDAGGPIETPKSKKYNHGITYKGKSS